MGLHLCVTSPRVSTRPTFFFVGLGCIGIKRNHAHLAAWFAQSALFLPLFIGQNCTAKKQLLLEPVLAVLHHHAMRNLLQAQRIRRGQALDFHVRPVADGSLVVNHGEEDQRVEVLAGR